MALTTASADIDSPLGLLRELLEDDRRDGLPWSPENFAQRVHLAVRETDSARSWTWAIIDTTPAWQAAYERRRRTPIANLSRELLDDSTDGRREPTHAPILGGIPQGAAYTDRDIYRRIAALAARQRAA